MTRRIRTMARTGTQLPPRFYRNTFMIGVGFFTMGLMDPLYDNYVPVFLSGFLESRALIGTFMTIDNIMALMLIPIVTAWSDRVRTPMGRRMPFIIVTLPLSAIMFALLPSAGMTSLAVFVAGLVGFNLFKQSARGPVVALMPDLIPNEYRSEANGVINMMGGIAAVVGTLALAPLMDAHLVLPVLGDTSRRLPFIISAVLIVVAAVLLWRTVHEKPMPESGGERVPVLKSLQQVFTARDRTAVYILIALFLWFCAYWGMRPFMTLYVIEYLGLSEGMAGFSTGMVAVAYLVFAVPSGMIAHRIGRKRTVRLALAGMALLGVLMFTHESWTLALGASQRAAVGSFWALLFVFGMCWGAANTNSFPMLWQMAGFKTMGAFTGVYYVFSQAAAIVAPPLTGVIVDAAEFRAIFAVAAVVMLASFLVMGRVSGGETQRAQG
ncbi:MAG: MFS transporter, partial [Spirochaetaceae bacterium]